jgi:membrane associated rhomboid family serine protease
VNESLASVLQAIVLALAAGAGIGFLGQRGPRGGRRRVPIATIVALLVVGVPSLLQLTVAPELLEVLKRDRTAIFGGEAWRLGSSLVVQDGGVAGTIFNLAALAVVGVIAEWIWGAGRWALIALVSGLGAQLWGLVVQPVGAGNSVAVFGLGASVAVAALVAGRGPARLLAGLSLLGAVFLLVVGDLHGGAAAIGAALGGILTWVDQRQGADDAPRSAQPS